MSLLHAVHFDAGVYPPEVVATGVGTLLSSTVKRTGGYSVSVRSVVAHFNNFVSMQLSASLSELYLQFGCYYTLLPSMASRIIRWKSAGGTVLGGLVLNHTTRQLEIYLGNFAGSPVATSSIALTTNTMHLIELRIKIADSGGIITLRVDLNEEAEFTGDTQPGADTAITAIDFGNFYNSATSFTYFDDIIVHDTTGARNNSWPDGAKVYYMVPTGDGSPVDWTPSTPGAHWSLVKEIPPSAVDNLQASVVAKVDALTFGSLPGDAQAVRAVIPEVHAFKGSSTTPTRLAVGLKIAAEAVEYSADKDLALAQGLVRHKWEERPGGGNFSVADLSALSLHLKSAA